MGKEEWRTEWRTDNWWDQPARPNTWRNNGWAWRTESAHGEWRTESAHGEWRTESAHGKDKGKKGKGKGKSKHTEKLDKSTIAEIEITGLFVGSTAKDRKNCATRFA